MSVINGKLIATSDINVAIAEANNGAKILYLGDIESKPNISGLITPTLLVPSYQSLSLLVDGRVKDYEMSYIRSLQSNDAVMSFASLLALLYYGNKVIMLFPLENSDLNYSEILLTHIQRVYGVTAQTKSSYFGYDQRFDPANARLLYLNSIINPVDYVMMTRVFNDLDINKLKVDLADSWKIPTNVSNQQFVEILGRKKENLAKYGTINEPLMGKVE